MSEKETKQELPETEEAEPQLEAEIEGDTGEDGEERSSEPQTPFEDLDLEDLLPKLEALLFAAEDPVNAREIADTLPEVSKRNAEPLIAALEEYYGENRRGLTVQRVAGGWRLATRPEYADVVRRHLRGRIRGRLSRASLETISIIAYRQPVSRPEIDEMRGVDSSPVVRTLLDRELIKVTGRAEAPGRPILYSTSEKFLEYFGLDSLGNLPKPEEILGEPDEEVAGTQINLRSGPFAGAGEGVEEETYRTPEMIAHGYVDDDDLEEEQAPLLPPTAEPEEETAAAKNEPEAEPEEPDPGETQPDESKD